ncbi:hypothetical protein RD110_16805 [Rhodoferax koreense]|uniref:diguanylate cyclase n=1 Tax=Rhodoferax koreensis TaxID=1842727 RepID=A0A1P8JY14_9BURK|nr:GGDEF domain-containing protein [Rhodoferax koreense]APW38654.1 hypothetical protein RD110_16805 [Rhodoferax koreense]
MRFRRHWVVGLGLALVLVFACISWLQVRQFLHFSASVSGSRIQELRRAATLANEFERFERALERSVYLPNAASREALQLRYDIFVNQFMVFANGRNQPEATDHPLYRRTLETVNAFIASFDHYLGANPDREVTPGALQEMLTLSETTMREPIHDYMLYANQRTTLLIDEQRNEVSDHLIFTLGLTIFQSLLTVAFAMGVVQLMRQREQSRHALVRAEARLVEHLRNQERRLEQSVAERTAELEAANRSLELLSATDGLTGIANRRHFDKLLLQEWNRQARLRQPLALAMLDVDWFKQYNDRYGHQAGDDCLRLVAGIVGGYVRRAGDVAARYGGEEFAFIAPGLDAAEMLHLAETIRAVVEHRGIPHSLSPVGHVTLSIGVAVLVPDARTSPELLLRQADEALYRAKSQGRNQVVTAAAAEYLV